MPLSTLKVYAELHGSKAMKQKMKENETEPVKALLGRVLNWGNGKDVESKLRSGLSC